MVTASDVKQLRDITGAGMMDCKNALKEADGHLEKAIDILKVKGIAKAAKKSGRLAAEGVVVYDIGTNNDPKRLTIIELNCETDFVAKSDSFIELSKSIFETIHHSDEHESGVAKVDGMLKDAISVIGENLSLRKHFRLNTDGFWFVYQHDASSIAYVAISQDNEEIGRDLAMHITAMKPQCIAPEDFPKDILAKEEAVIVEQLKSENKPEQIKEKIKLGRLNKLKSEGALMSQPFVKDSTMSVQAFLASKDKDLKVLDFGYIKVGDDIDVSQKSFKDEVNELLK
ncbi:MAG: translation elongation factor Ts [Candidatus Comchoanobacterales bacterium]